ncbi:pyridoxamine 5'-phosphate oxidase [Kribbella antiqua]|uniref:Pyridoxamine 5'-phosphate oxidase n=1 Tax=Kribbella antiqua TaxID=2512217 RepID=A0A4R2IZV7_9ACTN|nr:pyridoxamine 5'-phosphate oxidase family protein [Kribbella antiqua]TCO51433.1 pyridoxamine 5'-phosphate oxidase [Kribbella antiqua]
MTDPARPLSVRKQDTLRRLEQDVDAWVATAGADGTPYLMPLSFLWDGESLLISTAATNTTAQNLAQNPTLHLTLGPTRDVTHITATADLIHATDLPPTEAEAFAAKAGFDPRQAGNPYPYFRLTPTKVQAWREVNELKTRTLMKNGTWLV